MNARKHKHFKELCRACLKNLKNNSTDLQSSNSAVENNNLLIPNLCQLFLYFTSMDVSKETEIFPKFLCQLCLDKLMEYDNFRKVTMKSTATLYDMIKTDREEREEESIFPDDEGSEVVCVKKEKLSSGEDEDDDCDDDTRFRVTIKKEYNKYNDSENDDDQLVR